MALPNTYNRLDYVESSGTQYFNLSTLEINTLGRVECAFTFASSVSTYAACLLGSSSDYNSARIIRRYNGANSGWNFQVSGVSASGTSATNVLTTNTRYEFDVDFNNGYGKINDTIIYNFTGYPSSSSSFRNLYLLADNDSDGVSWKARGKLEYFKAYDRSGNLTMNLIPAIRKSDSVVGMYDDVNDVFYTNAGSGSFSHGSIVYEVSATENPTDSGTITGTGYYPSGNTASLLANANSGYIFDYWELDGFTRLEYIESTGTQWINTGINQDQVNNLKIVGKVMWIEVGGDVSILGLAVSSSGQRYFIYSYAGKWYFGAGNGSLDTGVAITTNQVYEVEVQMVSGNAYLKVDGTTLITETRSFTNYNSYELPLFALNYVGNVAYKSKARIYDDFLIYDTRSGNLIRHYIPVIRHSDGAIGLLDLVEMKFYGNSGTDTFIGGGVYAS